MEDLLKGIDWMELQEQKISLLKLRDSKRISKKCKEHLSGIVHLLDAIQDHAETILSEEVVFPSLCLYVEETLLYPLKDRGKSR